MLLTKRFWADSIERAIKTAAQTAGAIITAAQADNAMGTGLTNISWLGIFNVTGLAVTYSIIMSVASAGATGTDNGSAIK